MMMMRRRRRSLLLSSSDSCCSFLDDQTYHETSAYHLVEAISRACSCRHHHRWRPCFKSEAVDVPFRSCLLLGFCLVTRRADALKHEIMQVDDELGFRLNSQEE